MTGIRIAGVAVLVLLGAGVLIRVTNRSGIPPKNPERVPVEIRADEKLAGTETVNLKNGNLHLEIPIPAIRKR